MKKFTKILSIILVLAMAFCLMAGCGESAAEDNGGAAAATALKGKDPAKDEIKIAFLPLGASGETMIPTIEAFEFVRSAYPNVTYQILDSMFDVNTQLKNINECITQGFDAIIMQATDANAVNNAVAEAENAGIPVITLNMNCTGLHTAHIMNADYASGYDAAKYLHENKSLPDDAKVIVLDVVAEIKPVCQMGTGFEDYTKANTGWTILDNQPVENTSQENANTIMRDLLTKYDKIDAVYAVNDACAIGAIQAIEAAGRTGDGIKVWGFEGQPAALKAIDDGSLFGTSYCDQYTTSCEMMVLALNCIASGITGTQLGYETTPALASPTIPCTSANISEIIARSHYDMG